MWIAIWHVGEGNNMNMREWDTLMNDVIGIENCFDSLFNIYGIVELLW